MKLQKSYGSMSDYINGNIKDKIFLFQLSKRNAHPSFKNADGIPQFYPERQPVLLIDTIYDTISEQRRDIRYAEGVKSIFADPEKDKELKLKNHRVNFSRGIYTVEGDNPVLLDYMMRCNANGSNKDRLKNKKVIFNFIDKGKEFQEIMEKDDLEYDAVKWVKESKFDDIYGYARILLGPGIADREASEIKFDMRRLAKANPGKFLEGLKDPALVRKQMVYKALDKNILVVNSKTNSIAWVDNPQQPIVTAPVGGDVVDHLVRGTFSEKGEMTYNAIGKFVESAEAAEAKVELNDVPTPEIINETTPQLSPASNNASEAAQLLDDCVYEDIVEKNKNWYYYKDWKGNGKPNFITKILGDKALYDSMRLELQAKREKS